MNRCITKLSTAFALALLAAGAPSRADLHYEQTNLVSNRTDVGALTVDPNLRNPWGISSSATSPIWVSNQVTNTSTIYNGAGVKQALTVTNPGSPTGQVFNPTNDFAVNGSKAFFLFAQLNGTISAWNPSLGTSAQQVAASTSGAVYTGLGLGTTGGANFLYAADVLNGKIDVYDGTFAAVTPSGSFTDPNLPDASYHAYNVQNLGGELYVTYESETLGGGLVNVFDLDGNFLRRISFNADGGPLDDPWGVAIAPAGFGPFGGALLVGNEGDGHISAFDPTTGQFLGQLSDANGNPLANTGLWGLKFGTGTPNGGDANTLYFAAGINGEVDGLFGAIRAVPEPGSLALIGLGLMVMLGFRRLRVCPA